jgi:hypothetical protein
MKYTLSDKYSRLDITADSPEAAAQQWADAFDWTGLMVAFNRCTVRVGEMVVGEFRHARFALVEYTALLTPVTAKWNAGFSRYELSYDGGVHGNRTYVSPDGNGWELVGHDGGARPAADNDEAFRASFGIQLVGGPGDGVVLDSNWRRT